jgi:hypothetical protein
VALLLLDAQLGLDFAQALLQCGVGSCKIEKEKTINKVDQKEKWLPEDPA